MNDRSDRSEELRIQRATEGLSAAEQRELDALPGRPDDLDYELAAAAIQMAMTEVEAMPAHLRRRLEATAPPTRIPARPSAPVRERLAWLPLAAALALVFVGWLVLRPAPVPPVSDQREALVASAGDLVAWPWTATEDPAAAGASGDVVWSTERQAGFMRFRGLAPNDPTRSQYQLWVFDTERDERYPVDGGVFDVPAGADEVVVPIDPKIRVHEPALFAVTVEAPGGVVVSSRERIVVLAQP